MSTTTPNPIPVEFQSLFRYKERWQILICLEHKSVITSNALVGHLHRGHHWKKNVYRSLVQALSALPYTETPDDFPTPLNDWSPIEGIPVQKGYKCNHCEDMLTINKDHVGKHVFNCHRDLRTSRDLGYRDVSLQSWTYKGKYWTVHDPDAGLFSMATGALFNSSLAQSTDERVISWEERMSRMEADRLKDQDENDVLTTGK